MFKIYKTNHHRDDDVIIKAFIGILDYEGYNYEIVEDVKKCMVLGRGVGTPILCEDYKGKETYVGYHYIDLVNYLSESGRMRC